MGIFILLGIFGSSFLMPYLLTKLFKVLEIKAKNWLYLFSPIMANVLTVGFLLHWQWQREARFAADENATRCGMDSLVDLFLIFMIFVNAVIALIFQAYLMQKQISNVPNEMTEKIEQIGKNA